MQLPVVNDRAWYADGLDFTCTECGHCCSGGPGYVWLTREEVDRVAEYLSLDAREVMRRYCRKVGGQISLKELHNADRGEYDCIFLKEQPVTRNDNGQQTTVTQRICTIYPVRPLQCRTWPFWEGNLTSRKAWDRAAARCPGMNHGRHYTRSQIEALRDATDWPAAPPSSAPAQKAKATP